MKELSIREQYDFYTDTFNHIGTFLLSCSTEEIDYCVFEEFDGDCISFLNENFLSILLSNGLINEKIFHLSLKLAKKFRNIENTSLWNSASVKTHSYWFDMLTIADEIRSLLIIT